MTATSRSGGRNARRLIHIGLPGAATLLVLTIVIVSLAGKPAHTLVP
jgi:hypothetical protein